SRSAGLRFLLMGVALLMENIWIAIQWRYLHRRQRGPRRVARDQLRLPRLCAWIVDAVTTIYGMVRAIPLAPYRPYRPREPIL
ncbi:MAG TPA: hypothetical protein VD886_15160, partial [Herpetosiphonaceae bacterium]|nr:hypothetical protein [Herpetosiphonaceae bacterium]